MTEAVGRVATAHEAGGGGAPRHALDALLAPRSIALVGASDRPESLGHAMVLMARAGGYAGRVHPINPRLAAIEGLAAAPSLAALVEPVEHVAIGLGNDRLEAVLAEAIAHGARAATIFASAQPPCDGGRLRARLGAMAREAGLALCGPNCMGFYNNLIGLRVAGYPALNPMPPGPIALVAQSGSVFGAFAHNDPRLRFALAVSSGAELVTTMADYLAWAAARPEIRAVGLFLEAAREPVAFEAALALAAERGVAVVALKVGRTPASAAMALSHTGAVAGVDGAYRALFRRYGVMQVDDLDEMAATLLLAAQGRPPAEGGLVAIHDSGGERELVADLVAAAGMTYAPLAPETVSRLRQIIDPELEPQNPLDAWGSASDFRTVFADAFTALVQDPNAALGVMFVDARDNYFVHAGYAAAALAAHARTQKPVALATNLSLVRNPSLAERLTAQGVPVLEGSRPALAAVHHLLARRDMRRIARPGSRPAALPDALPPEWRRRLAPGGPQPGEDAALELLAAYGIATPQRETVGGAADLTAAAGRVGFPLALKSAAPGLLHKTEVGGVRLGLTDRAALEVAYADMAARLGPEAILAEMAPAGVELALGALVDPAFGPLVTVGAGGVLVELLADQAVALAPASGAEARAMLAELRLAPLLAGHRGRPPADLDAVVAAIVGLGWLIRDAADLVQAIDVNPLIAGPAGAVAVDALILPREAGPWT